MTLQRSREKSSVIIFVYVMGLLLQAIYLPYQARSSPNFLTASIDAGYSWVWDRPIYYDSENNKNISSAELGAWREKNAGSSKPLDDLFNPLRKYLERNESGLPSTWIQIYGIDYKRLLLSLVLWTILNVRAVLCRKEKYYAELISAEFIQEYIIILRHRESMF